MEKAGGEKDTRAMIFKMAVFEKSSLIVKLLLFEELMRIEKRQRATKKRKLQTLAKCIQLETEILELTRMIRP